MAAAIDDAIETASRNLRRDLFLAGSFMLVMEERELPDDSGRAARRAQKWVDGWNAWHAEAADRITLEERLLALRESIVDDRVRFIDDVVAGAVNPLLELAERSEQAIEALHDEAARACDAAAAEGDAKALDARLEALGKAAARALDRDLLAAFADGTIERRIQAAADDAVERVASTLGELPETLTVHEPSPDGPREPGAEPATVRVAMIAGRTFDALLLERLRTTPQPLLLAVERIHAEASQLPSVVRFNVDAARDELGTALDGDHIAPARELALNGLARTREAIAGHAASLAEASSTYVDEVGAVFERGWDALVARVRVEDRVQEQLLDLRYRLRMATHRLSERAGVRLRQGAETGRRVVRLGRGRAEELVRLSQTAMGASDMSDEAMHATLDALSGLERMIAGQPLVYRRLFSFQPLADPALLQGREADVAVVRRHYEHWRDGQTDAIAITGYDGNGRSSFVNIVRQTMFADADVQSVSIDGRILDEPRLASLLAGVLGIEEERADSLDALAAALLESPQRERPRVVFVERMEHLFLRTAAGNGLIAQALAFLSRTDSRVFWIVTMGDYLWQYLSRVDPATASLVKRYALAPLGAADLERIVMSRHVRSGLPLEFDAPEVPNPLLKRKLRRAATAEDRQAILRTEYFERIARFAGQNILLTFFYWLRSAELDASTGVLRIRPCEPLDFAYLDRFTLQQGFTLKAFLEHGTLTLDEHCEIFQVGRESSRKTLESLGNFLLIEPADGRARAADFVFSTIAESSAYQIRPLVVHPVLLYLRSKNIVY
jgi:hypothetical protein